MAIDLDTDIVRHHIDLRVFRVYVSGTAHLIVPHSIPAHYLSHISDVESNLTIYSNSVGNKYTKKALERIGDDVDVDDYTKDLDVLVTGLPNDKSTWYRMKSAPGNEHRNMAPNGVLWSELYLTRAKGVPVAGQPLRREARVWRQAEVHAVQPCVSARRALLLEPAVRRPAHQGGPGHFDVVFLKVETEGRDRYFGAIGFDNARCGKNRPKTRSRANKFTKQTMKKRNQQAMKAGYICHAERCDKSFTYMQQMMRECVPRMIEIAQTDDRTGDATGVYYFPDEAYLRVNTWESSPCYAELLAFARNRARMLVRLPSHITELQGEV